MNLVQLIRSMRMISNRNGSTFALASFLGLKQSENCRNRVCQRRYRYRWIILPEKVPVQMGYSAREGTGIDGLFCQRRYRYRWIILPEKVPVQMDYSAREGTGIDGLFCQRRYRYRWIILPEKVPVQMDYSAREGTGIDGLFCQRRYRYRWVILPEKVPVQMDYSIKITQKACISSKQVLWNSLLVFEPLLRDRRTEEMRALYGTGSYCLQNLKGSQLAMQNGIRDGVSSRIRFMSALFAYSHLATKRTWTFIVFREDCQGGRSYQRVDALIRGWTLLLEGGRLLLVKQNSRVDVYSNVDAY